MEEIRHFLPYNVLMDNKDNLHCFDHFTWIIAEISEIDINSEIFLFVHHAGLKGSDLQKKKITWPTNAFYVYFFLQCLLPSYWHESLKKAVYCVNNSACICKRIFN